MQILTRQNHIHVYYTEVSQP